MLNTLTLAGIDGEIIPIVAITGAFVMIIIGMVMKTVNNAYETKQREETRREVAAYVAEGSISPDDAERILNAGGRDSVRIGKDGIHIQA